MSKQYPPIITVYSCCDKFGENRDLPKVQKWRISRWYSCCSRSRTGQQHFYWDYFKPEPSENV